MNGGVLIFSPINEDGSDSGSRKLIAKGREIADSLSSRLSMIILGEDISQSAQEFETSGVDQIIKLDHSLLHYYNLDAYSKVLIDIINDINPTIVLLGHTHIGLELGPAIATRLGVSLSSNCIDIRVNKEKLKITRATYGGKFHMTIRLKQSSPIIITLQEAFLPSKQLKGKKAEIINCNSTLNNSDIRTKVVEFLKTQDAEIDITKAEIIVAGGRGLLKKENFKLLADLAETLGAVLACSRPTVDLGWLPSSQLVGISGKIVKPKLYIACGISGAPQHLAGMRESQKVVVINKDPNAPIFNLADYAIIGDLFEVVPILTQEAKRLWGERS